MAEVSNPSDKGYTDASGAYGFGSPEPSRDVPDRNGDSVGTSTEENTSPIFPLLDEEFTDNIRGQSPVDGLQFDFHAWEKTSIHPSWQDNVAETPGAVTRPLGAWPIKGTALDPSLSHIAGQEDKDWTGHTPGTEQSGERPV